jgi:hypothetical protein
MIKISDLRLHQILISPHYGDATDDGTPAGRNGCQYKSQPRFAARMEAKIDTNHKKMRAWQEERKTDQEVRKATDSEANREERERGRAREGPQGRSCSEIF